MPKFTFTAAPPVKQQEISIPEWDPEEKFRISELRANECQDFIGIVNKIQSENSLDFRGIELYADMLSRCLSTSDGERPIKEWLMTASFATLKRVGDEALKLNGFSQETTQAIEKN